MTPNRESSPDYGDAEFLELLANLNLEDVEQDRAPPPALPPLTPSPRTPAARTISPRTPSPDCPPYTAARHTFPQARTLNVTGAQTVYQYDTPTRSGITTDWSSAGSATQGIPGARVHVVGSPAKKKSEGSKEAYVVFCGLHCVLFRTWAETKPLVLGVSNSIFRGYATLSEAEAALAYARARGWIRVAIPSGIPPPIAHLPLPNTDPRNPLNGNEEINERWYVVYRGVCPGVYRSHLECQLNTLGVRGAVHESIKGEAAACAKYRSAVARSETAVVTPTYFAEIDASDPFL
ncbi:hypothetical protein B0H11DRAFT_2243298 [Mycena galericulata]|nr:hypothetical protein B0H11DRAFT_2243298 [Mycena galericulata]